MSAPEWWTPERLARRQENSVAAAMDRPALTPEDWRRAVTGPDATRKKLRPRLVGRDEARDARKSKRNRLALLAEVRRRDAEEKRADRLRHRYRQRMKGTYEGNWERA